MNRHQIQYQEQLVNQLGLKITARLTESTDHMPHDILERLRAARVQAVDKRKLVLQQAANLQFAQHRSGTLTASQSGWHTNWWQRLGGAGLLLVLAAGLLLINLVQDELGAREMAAIDAAILTDDLPPAAFLDVGFAQFLKSGNHQEP
ncbi:MAG: DUF3619 domain-containing protein [Betaproteobacteria bacterium HGW-Betaproteobacteria-18]|nr:MAG: DUF3619 domain-containing protein [Betaproteobacteria bacterium HGW-Betaproteobacteria-18]